MTIKLIKTITGVLLFTGVALFYFTYDPVNSLYFPECPFYKFTHLFCPGCGAQRAIHYVLTGNIAAAVRSNILLVIFLPFLIAYYSVQVFNYFYLNKNRQIAILQKGWFIYGLALLFLFYWVARNVEVFGASFLAPH